MQRSNLWVWSLIQLIGFCAIVCGTWLIAPWLAFIVGGLGLLVYGTLREMADGPRKDAPVGG